MTYFVSLKITALIIGTLLLLGHLGAALAPAKFGAMMRTWPRNYPLGIVLMLSATLWFVVLTGVMDLGEISGFRLQLMIAWAAAGILMTIFVPQFLAVRGLGCLMLLAAALVIDAGFLALTPWRYLMTLLAYAWVLGGMVLVYSPHLGRDAVNYFAAAPQRMRLASWAGVIYGAVLIVVAIIAYP
jgi:hypothetical protein